MTLQRTTVVEAKLAYARAEWTKRIRSGELVFKSSMRERYYEQFRWLTGMVPLAACVVEWPMGMGFRRWARGAVPEIARGFMRRRSDPLWKMVRAMKRERIEPLPIIVIKQGRRFTIDDGCHRAVAAWLINAKTISAFVAFHL